MENTGIYALIFNQDLVYIGKSSVLARRKNDHLSNLLKGIANYKMQEAYDLYGTPEFVIIEVCSLEDLNIKEVYWIKEFNSIDEGLNISSGGDGGGSGTTHNRAIHSKETLLEVLSLLAETTEVCTYTKISDITGVSISTITNIADSNAHTWLREELPLKYDLVTSDATLRGTRASLAKEEAYSKIRGIKKGTVIFPDIKDPEGTVYKGISNAKKFAEEHTLSPQGLCRLFSGKINSHRNWTLA